MRLSIMLTVTDSDKDATDPSLLLEYTPEYINYVIKQLKANSINVLRLGTGLHINASRLHTHIAFIMEYAGKDIKTWDKKLRGYLSAERECQDEFEVRISIYKESHPKYCETIGTQYCLKEYDNFDKILMLDKFIGFTNEEIEQLRYNGNAEYTKKLKKHESDERRREMEENETIAIFEYITEQIKNYDTENSFRFLVDNQQTNPYCITMKEKITKIKLFILGYYRQKARATGKIKFKAYTIRDLAVNYLTKNLEDDFLLGELAELI